MSRVCQLDFDARPGFVPGRDGRLGAALFAVSFAGFFAGDAVARFFVTVDFLVGFEAFDLGLEAPAAGAIEAGRSCRG